MVRTTQVAVLTAVILMLVSVPVTTAQEVRTPESPVTGPVSASFYLNMDGDSGTATAACTPISVSASAEGSSDKGKGVEVSVSVKFNGVVFGPESKSASDSDDTRASVEETIRRLGDVGIPFQVEASAVVKVDGATIDEDSCMWPFDPSDICCADTGALPRTLFDS